MRAAVAEPVRRLGRRLWGRPRPVMDAGVTFTMMHRVWQVAAGGLTILLVPRFLTPVEQGLFFTFGSLVALQVIFELGLGTVLTQFAAHEMSVLQWTSERTLAGESAALARIRGLTRFALRWYSVGALVLVVLLIPGGAYFLRSRPEAAAVAGWEGAWTVLAVSTGITLAMAPVFAIMEGTGRVAHVARFRLGQEVAAYGALVATLAAGGGVMAYAALQSVRAVAELGYAARHAPRLAGSRGESNAVSAPMWRREIWPMQWRIALSWVSGYFIFQLFNPIAYATSGPVAAGQFGLTISMTTAIATVSMSMVTARVPSFGRLIALRDYDALDALFARALRAAVLVAAVGAVMLVAGVVVLLRVWPATWDARVLPPLPAAALALASVVNVGIFSAAAYLRAFKEEPLLVNSLIGAVITPPILILAGRWAGVSGMAYAYLLLNATVGVAMTTVVFVLTRRRWRRAVV